MTKIAILVPCYNHAEYLSEAVTSAHAAQMQSEESLQIELFIGDDGSTDNSANEMERLKKQFHGTENFTVSTLLSQENQGANAMINKLIARAMGTDPDYCIILDADDRLNPGYFNITIPALQSAATKNPKTGFAYTNSHLIDPVGNYLKRGISIPFNIEVLRARQSYIPSTSLMQAECLFSGYPYPEKDLAGDTIRVATKFYRYSKLCLGKGPRQDWVGVHVAEPAFSYRMHPGQISGIGIHVLAGKAVALTTGDYARPPDSDEIYLGNYWQAPETAELRSEMT